MYIYFLKIYCMFVCICVYDMCVNVEVIYRSQLSNVMVAWLVVWLFCFVSFLSLLQRLLSLGTSAERMPYQIGLLASYDWRRRAHLMVGGAVLGTCMYVWGASQYTTFLHGFCFSFCLEFLLWLPLAIECDPRVISRNKLFTLQVVFGHSVLSQQ